MPEGPAQEGEKKRTKDASKYKKLKQKYALIVHEHNRALRTNLALSDNLARTHKRLRKLEMHQKAILGNLSVKLSELENTVQERATLVSREVRRAIQWRKKHPQTLSGSIIDRVFGHLATIKGIVAPRPAPFPKDITLKTNQRSSGGFTFESYAITKATENSAEKFHDAACGTMGTDKNADVPVTARLLQKSMFTSSGELENDFAPSFAGVTREKGKAVAP